MFFRWTQENFFKYMRQESDIDHLYTYDVEKADPNRLVPNPDKKDKKKLLNKLKSSINKCKKEYAELTLMRKKNDDVPLIESMESIISQLGEKIRELETEFQKFKNLTKTIPQKIPLRQILNEGEIVKLETERKIFTDIIKMLCYRTETELFNLIYPFFSRQEEEGRTFLKNIFQLPGDLIPNEKEGQIIVRFHTMANKRSNYALSELCRLMNDEKCIYPGTDLMLIYKSARF